LGPIILTAVLEQLDRISGFGPRCGLATLVSAQRRSSLIITEPNKFLCQISNRNMPFQKGNHYHNGGLRREVTVELVTQLNEMLKCKDGVDRTKLVATYQAAELKFFNGHAALVEPQNFAAFLTPLRNSEWVVYSKRPFGGPKQVLRYLARYTHRVAISNRRLIACDQKGVTFKWKDYRLEGPERYQAMTLATHEFIRRFLMHVLPAGFHRIRYYGLLASGKRAENVARARELLMPPIIPVDAIKASSPNAAEPQTAKHSCPCCGGRMIIIERFERGATPRYRPSPPTPAVRIDTS
jgi:hypothetical protein